jgi:hypothetical protein
LRRAHTEETADAVSHRPGSRTDRADTDGDYDAAIDELDYLLSIPSSVSVPQLQLHPMWDPLRDHPRFQALLAKYE